MNVQVRVAIEESPATPKSVWAGAKRSSTTCRHRGPGRKPVSAHTDAGTSLTAARFDAAGEIVPGQGDDPRLLVAGVKHLHDLLGFFNQPAGGVDVQDDDGRLPRHRIGQ